MILREALRNAILTSLTLVGMQFTCLIGGTAIIERLFSHEELGNMAIDAVINRDLPLIQSIVILFAVIFTVKVEAILSFVNLSISTDDPTWGGRIAEGRTSVHHAWCVLVFSQSGEGVTERFDPALR